jgi:hypothetical protein
MQDRATPESDPSGISASEGATPGVAPFLLLLKPKAINSGVKGQSPLLYNLILQLKVGWRIKACN